ncbi:MAG: DMT family transporter [Candidatus Thorarchaeota archaeon]
METSKLTTHRDSRRTRIIAIIQALFVTTLWSSSFIIVKFGLDEIPPLTYAAFRYMFGSLILVALILGQKKIRSELGNRSRRWWLSLFFYGFIFIAVTQGAHFLALLYLPAITFSLVLNMTPLLVLILAIPWIGEKPSLKESGFVLLGIIGVLLYFFPLDFVEVSTIGLVIALISLLANAVSSIVGRAVNKRRDASPLVITGIMMSVGSVFLLVFSLMIEPIVSLSPMSWLNILWLAFVNTALAFTLWSRSQRVLRAIDMTLINSTMMPQIVILSIIFLGEFPELLDWIGIGSLTFSVTAVQYLQTKRAEKRKTDNQKG